MQATFLKCWLWILLKYATSLPTRQHMCQCEQHLCPRGRQHLCSCERYLRPHGQHFWPHGQHLSRCGPISADPRTSLACGDSRAMLAQKQNAYEIVIDTVSETHELLLWINCYELIITNYHYIFNSRRSRHSLTHSLIDWLTDWLTHWLTESRHSRHSRRSRHWLTHWLTDSLIDWTWFLL